LPQFDAETHFRSSHVDGQTHNSVSRSRSNGLLTDLKQRGVLDSTLVVWGGEFGRMPVSQKGDGRDHNPNGFLQWMTGVFVFCAFNCSWPTQPTQARL
jgi:hypothetical protein